MNHGPAARYNARPVDQQSSALPLYRGCPPNNCVVGRVGVDGRLGNNSIVNGKMNRILFRVEIRTFFIFVIVYRHSYFLVIAIVNKNNNFVESVSIIIWSILSYKQYILWPVIRLLCICLWLSKKLILWGFSNENNTYVYVVNGKVLVQNSIAQWYNYYGKLLQRSQCWWFWLLLQDIHQYSQTTISLNITLLHPFLVHSDLKLMCISL